jgi:hypothetical protein
MLLDPSTVSERPPSGGIDTIVYPSTTLGQIHRNFTNVGLRSFVVDNEYYNIVDDSPYGLQNNIITLNGNPITIPPGNYDANNLLIELLALFNVAGPGVYTGSFDAITMTFTFNSTVPFTLDFGATSPYLELGFALGGSYGPAASITSIWPINLSGPPNILIQIPELTSGSIISYSTTAFAFMYPLTGSFPSLSQANWITAGKADCPLNGFNQIYQLTVRLFYTRDGKVWPYISWPRTSYQLLLEFS